ncbi:SDR family NAD(P)-dependent oxidoreductase [Pseudomonas sp. GL-R-19]|uniref:SDR family NAD(P)-dependent oxidoreductase n=1 Tax=Pseudomonas sp. GL-R-19 TaxID=2832391 RepID=UPI001CBF15E3|nr:SDR family oxidoreductase [Pseudomonas sp. GL-R-19]
MDLHLNGKRVIVTGGSKGIGLACTLAFAAEGAQVAIISRDRAHLEAARGEFARRGLQVITHAQDLASADGCASTMAILEEELGPLDILINCAGAAKKHALDALEPAHFHAALHAKFTPYLNMQNEALQCFRRQRGSGSREDKAIVNIIGIGGRHVMANHLAGGLANAALLFLNAGLANAYASSAIRINAINPGLTLTERTEKTLAFEAGLGNSTVEAVLKAKEAALPIGRLANPEEIADVALFLASPRASYVTGAVIDMDGGLHPSL